MITQLYLFPDVCPPTEQSGPSFRDLLRQYQTWLWTRVRYGQLSARSAEDQIRDLTRFVAWQEQRGRIYVTQAERQDPLDFIHAQTQWRSDAVKKRIWAYIRAWFRRACRERWIAVNPYADLEVPRWHTRARAEMLPRDYVAIMRASPRWLRHILFVLWNTGMRPNEALRLTAADIRDGCAHVANKARQHQGPVRLVGLPPAVERFLLHLARRRPSGPLLRSLTGRPLHPRQVAKYLHVVTVRLGLTHLTAYSCRHAYATQAREAGVEALRVDAQLGHSPGLRGLGILEHYSGRLRLAAGYLREIAEEIAWRRRDFRIRRRARLRLVRA